MLSGREGAEDVATDPDAESLMVDALGKVVGGKVVGKKAVGESGGGKKQEKKLGDKRWGNSKAVGNLGGNPGMVLSYWAVWGIGRVVGIFYIFMEKTNQPTLQIKTNQNRALISTINIEC
jgi:hypothetical protein